MVRKIESLITTDMPTITLPAYINIQYILNLAPPPYSMPPFPPLPPPIHPQWFPYAHFYPFFLCIFLLILSLLLLNLIHIAQLLPLFIFKLKINSLHITHLCHFSKSKFNLKSDRVNLVAPASFCFIYPKSGRYSTNWDRKG